MNWIYLGGPFGMGFGELVVILLIVLLLFGAGRIRTIMREFGGGISEFKKGMREVDEDKKPPSSGGPGKINPN